MKTKTVYKLFKINGGKLYPLYIDWKEELPLGQWLTAKEPEKTAKGKVKSKSLGELAYRPGFHCTDVPCVYHIGRKMQNNKLCQAADTVWCEVLLNANTDYTESVKIGRNPRNWCLKTLPTNGFYQYQTNAKAIGTWFITSDIYIVRILSSEEVKSICNAAGITPQITEEEYLKGVNL